AKRPRHAATATCLPSPCSLCRVTPRRLRRRAERRQHRWAVGAGRWAESPGRRQVPGPAHLRRYTPLGRYLVRRSFSCPCPVSRCSIHPSRQCRGGTSSRGPLTHATHPSRTQRPHLRAPGQGQGQGQGRAAKHQASTHAHGDTHK
ncbi:hypothetical protein Landi51_04848, partial [Colletotrichum acutatum]